MMRLFKLVMAAVAMLGLAASASAQQPANGTPAAGGAAVAIPKGKIAVIDTARFQDQVLEFKSKMDALNRQFDTRIKEVQGLADRINALETTLKTQSTALSAAKAAEMTEQLEGMKRDYQRKSEDLQADANRARQKAFEPISGKLGKFAEQYTAKKGIVLLIDLANAEQAGAVLWFDPRADVTQDFINEYNKANPVTSGPAPAAPAKP
ncbi:MAG TPA: OmpH family outer membrane protein [Blastocatellia bacterium]|nr:OmpH family outer membrane protein [Blastocatellia bacterium]